MIHLTILFDALIENSIYLLLFSLVIFFISSFGGKYLYKKRRGNEEIADSETSIIIGAILSFLALLIGFVLSTAITGYNARQETESKEAINIGVAIHSIQLLNESDKNQAQSLLQSYLTARIGFFNESGEAQDKYRNESFKNQDLLLEMLLSKKEMIDSVYYTKLIDIYTDLYASQLQTEAYWKYQIPRAAWVLLFIFAIIANAFIGYNLRGIKGKNGLLTFVPMLIALSFYIVAEIDSPSQGFINVTPDNLISLNHHYFKSLQK